MKFEVSSLARPTLFIGLGGSGLEVMLRMRRRILNAGWGPGGAQKVNDFSDFPVAQFLHVDLDTHQTLEQGVDSQADPLAEVVRLPNEDRLCEPFDLGHYTEGDGALDRYPLIKAWFPLSPAKMRELAIDPSKGAGQVRALGRLYFFDKYDKVRDRLRSKLLALKTSQSKWDLFDRLGLKPGGEKLRVVVICSVAGGTGSGIFLDMGFLAKSVASEMFGSTDTHLMLMLPSGYSARNKQRVEANGYAALKELETCMRGDFKFVDAWSHTDAHQTPARPYDDVYLIDSGNAAGHYTAKQADVYEMVADVLFEDFGSEDYATRKRSTAVNQQQFKIRPYEPTVPREYGDMNLPFCASYSAFGHAVLDVGQLLTSRSLAESAGAAALVANVEVDQDPLLLALDEMDPVARQRRFSELLTRAMPWVQANLGGAYKVKADQYKVFLGVSSSKDFERFKGEFIEQAPGEAGLQANQIQFVDTGVPGRAVCYVELSGIPLTVLRGLDHWRDSYRNENIRIPPHIHKDMTRFVHPSAPSPTELKQLTEDFQTYLKAVALGVFLRNPKRDVIPPGLYRLEFEPGELRNVGNERAFRLHGLPTDYRARIIEVLEVRLAGLNTHQFVALSALFEHYERVTYSPKIVADDLGGEALRQGFASAMAKIVAQQLRGKAVRMDVPSSEVDVWRAVALRSLPTWTVEVDGSETDAYPWEVQEAEDGSPRLKRVVKPEFFSDSWTIPGLQSAASAGNVSTAIYPTGLAPPHGVPPALAPSGAMPPPLPTLQFWLNVNGQNYGPYPVPTLQAMIPTNQFAATSMVWREGMASWAQASAVPELAALFLPRPPAGPGFPPPVGGGMPP